MVTGPVLLKEIPALHLVAPAEESVISYSNEPDFRLEGVASGRPLRLSLYFVVGPAYYFLKCTFRSDQLRILANGVVVCRPDEDVLQVTDYQGLTWRTLPSHLETLLRDYGIGHVQVRWRAETLSLSRLTNLPD